MAHARSGDHDTSPGWRYVLPVVVLAALGVLISTGLAQRQNRDIEVSMRSAVEDSVTMTSQNASRSLGSLRGSMSAYPAMYVVAAPVSADDFDTFSRKTLSYRDDVNFVVYAPSRGDSLPVEYAVAEKPELAKSVDLANDPVSEAAVRAARDQGQTVLIGRTSSPFGGPPAVFAYTPVFDGTTFEGVVVAAIDVQRWMTQASSTVAPEQYSLALLDGGLAPAEVLWSNGSTTSAQTATSPMDVSGLQRLTVAGGPGPAMLGAVPSWRPWAFFIGGLLVTAAMCALVWWWLDARQIRRTADDLQQATNRLRFLAERDALTGLSHRDGLRSWLEDWTQRNPDRELALLYVDLDGFKEINTTWGHFSGDLVLRQVGHRLSVLADDRESVVARVSGDQFVVMRPLDQGSLDALVATTQTLIADPIPVGDRDIQLTSSIGMVVRPEDGNNLDTLLSNADMAARAAKDLPGNSALRYDPVLAAHGAQRQQMARDLRAAVRDPDAHFHLAFQPQVDMRTGKLIAAEALIRWRRGEEIVPPTDFLSLASDYGLMSQLGRWVLAKSCQVVGQWRMEAPGVVAVNVDGQQLDSGFADVVTSVLREAGISPEWLVVEVTEAAAMGATAQRELDRIRALGVSISIDDFGTGFSSLSRLADLPTQQLKIDRAFVTGLGHSPEALEIVRTVVALSRALGLQALAEGVETADQAQVLMSEGVEIGQGFLFGAPLPADECLALWHTGVSVPRVNV